MPQEALVAQINAYRKDTGEKVVIPEHWLDHDVLSKPFNKTPRQRAADMKKATPATTETPAQPEKGA
jgi:hypothetical protein